MSFNTFGKLFRFTTWGESHGPALGCVVDGCPPNIPLKDSDIQKELNRRKPGQSKFVTQRKESDTVHILSGVFEGKTTGTPISLVIYNEDQKSKDYGDIKDKFRPGHADFTYFKNTEFEIIEVEEDHLPEKLLRELQRVLLREKVWKNLEKNLILLEQ